jgi:hypothetical protein
VKNNIRILSVIALTAIYCFAIGCITNSLGLGICNSTQVPVQDTALSELTANFYNHIPQPDNSLQTANSMGLSCSKEIQLGYGIVAKAIELEVAIKFTQNTYLLYSYLINYRKSDKLFPFHYFW